MNTRPSDLSTGAMCESVADACFSQPCFNNGSCSYRGLCSCPDVIARCGWHDDTCQRDVCSNRLDCSVHSTPFTCDCSHTGFTGSQCADDVDECLRVNACLNGGVCQNTLGSYNCSCQGTGYQGDRCEKNVDECVVDPTVCYNGGECSHQQQLATGLWVDRRVSCFAKYILDETCRT